MTDPDLKDVVVCIEADSFSRYALWCLYASDSPYRYKELRKPITWEQIFTGFIHKVGYVSGAPVTVEVFCVHINGGLVLFYDAASKVVDWGLIESWLTENVPAYKAGRATDANNFHNALRYLEAANAPNQSCSRNPSRGPGPYPVQGREDV